MPNLLLFPEESQPQPQPIEINPQPEPQPIHIDSEPSSPKSAISLEIPANKEPAQPPKIGQAIDEDSDSPVPQHILHQPINGSHFLIYEQEYSDSEFSLNSVETVETMIGYDLFSEPYQQHHERMSRRLNQTKKDASQRLKLARKCQLESMEVLDYDKDDDDLLPITPLFTNELDLHQPNYINELRDHMQRKRHQDIRNRNAAVSQTNGTFTPYNAEFTDVIPNIASFTDYIVQHNVFASSNALEDLIDGIPIPDWPSRLTDISNRLRGLGFNSSVNGNVISLRHDTNPTYTRPAANIMNHLKNQLRLKNRAMSDEEIIAIARIFNYAHPTMHRIVAEVLEIMRENVPFPSWNIIFGRPEHLEAELFIDEPILQAVINWLTIPVHEGPLLTLPNQKSRRMLRISTGAHKLQRFFNKRLLSIMRERFIIELPIIRNYIISLLRHDEELFLENGVVVPALDASPQFFPKTPDEILAFVLQCIDSLPNLTELAFMLQGFKQRNVVVNPPIRNLVPFSLRRVRAQLHLIFHGFNNQVFHRVVDWINQVSGIEVSPLRFHNYLQNRFDVGLQELQGADCMTKWRLILVRMMSDPFDNNDKDNVFLFVGALALLCRMRPINQNQQPIQGTVELHFFVYLVIACISE